LAILNPTSCASRRASGHIAVYLPLATFLANSNNSLILPAIGVVAGLYLFFRGFFLLQRKRMIQNTPASKIRSASLGLVEVSGLALGPYLMNAPITGLPCYCYRTVAWQEKQSGKNKEWEIVAEDNFHVPFFLDDNTGKLLIDPRGAELDLHCDFKREFSDSIFSSDDAIPGEVRTFLARHNVSSDRKTRVEEYCIKPKNALFILGTLAENPGVAATPNPVRTNNGGGLKLMAPTFSNPLSFALKLSLSTGPSSTVPWNDQAVPPEIVNLSAAQPAPASASDMTQQGKIAAALQRAGVSNPAAWAAAGVPYQPIAVRPSSTQLAAAAPSAMAKGTSATTNSSAIPEFDSKPPVVLMKGTNNPAFLISWRNQREVVSTMSWKSGAMIWGGPALTLTCLYFLAAQFGWL
jgi:hypothetical protein